MVELETDWMDVDEAATYLGCSTRTIRRYATDGELRHTRIGHMLRFRRTWLDSWMDTRASGGPEPSVADRLLEETA